MEKKKERKELKERRQERKVKDRLGERCVCVCVCVGGSWELMVVSRVLVQAWTRDKDEEMRLR